MVLQYTSGMSSHLTPQASRVEEWLRVHRLLMEKEAAFNEIALRAAAGELSLDELDRERNVLMGLRALCTSVYEQAFPRSTRA
jgi:hypothetical protein